MGSFVDGTGPAFSGSLFPFLFVRSHAEPCRAGTR